MDPNATLKELRELLKRGMRPDLERARELFEALDEWILKGGFLPDDWKP